MKRYYFVTEDLDDLGVVEQQLDQAGIGTPQVHVLSENDQGVEQRHLHEVNSLMRRDMVHSWKIGAIFGVLVAAAIMVAAYLTGMTETVAGWLPFIFLAVIAFGFCVWEGGLFGFRKPNSHFRRFQQELKQGKHIFFVEVDENQEEVARRIILQHPKLREVGKGDSTPAWFISWQKKWNHFVDVMP